MSPTPIIRYAALTMVLSLAAPSSGEGQVLGRLKKKLQQGVESTVRAHAGESSPPAGPVHDDDVVEMTPGILDRFAQALAAEDAKREEVLPLIRALPAERQARASAAATRRGAEREWRACAKEVQSRPEYTSRRDEHQRRGAAVGERVRAGTMDPQAAGRAATEIGADVAALAQEIDEAVTRTCGRGPGARPDGTSNSVPSEDQLRGEPLRAALAAGGFTARQYAILKERVVPFCAGATPPGSDGVVRIPGSDKRFYVYGEAEVEALRPRCGALRPSLEAVL